VIPTEDNYIDWTLLGMRGYFEALGYRVWTFSIGQVKEKKCPVDRILAAGNKMIGFQFKRPALQGPAWRWKVNPDQHRMIVHSDWVWYCLPDFVDPCLQNVALYHCQFRSGGVAHRGYLERGRYYRWGWVATSLIACRVGVEMDKEIGVDALFAEIAENPQDAYLSLNRLAREAYLIAGERPSEPGLEREPA